LHEKIGTAIGAEGIEGGGRESSKAERMGRDGKLTRSLLPGALEAENKERERERDRWGERGGGREREIEEIASHIGDRLVRAVRHFVRLFRQSKRFIYLTNLLREIRTNLLRKLRNCENGKI